MVNRPRRSLLFTPATRPEAFGKAARCGADIVCVDLEDAVPPEMKDAARPDAISFLSGGDGACQRAVRINHPASRVGLGDLAAVADAAPRDGLLIVPKVCDAAEIRLADALLTEAGSGLELAALIETLDGLEHVHRIAVSTPRLKLLVFGAVDLSAEMGVPNAPGPLAYARGRLVHAGKRAGLDVMDVPELDFRDTDLARRTSIAAREHGFTGKAAIHPISIPVINEAFTPSPAEVDEARAVIAAFEASENGLAVVDGKLIEAPVIRAMERRLRIAELIAAGDTS